MTLTTDLSGYICWQPMSSVKSGHPVISLPGNWLVIASKRMRGVGPQLFRPFPPRNWQILRAKSIARRCCCMGALFKPYYQREIS